MLLHLSRLTYKFTVVVYVYTRTMYIIFFFINTTYSAIYKINVQFTLINKTRPVVYTVYRMQSTPRYWCHNVASTMNFSHDTKTTTNIN